MCTFLADDNWVNHTEIFMGHTQVHDKYTFGFMLPALFYRADGHNRRCYLESEDLVYCMNM